MKEKSNNIKKGFSSNHSKEDVAPPQQPEEKRADFGFSSNQAKIDTGEGFSSNQSKEEVSAKPRPKKDERNDKDNS